MSKLKRHQLLALVLGAAILFIGGCGSTDAASSQSQGSDVSFEPETITVKHAFGEAVVKKNPEKVVVFDFGILDTLDIMGVKVIGVPQSGTIPSSLEKYASSQYANVGSVKEPDFEKIYELQPDVILISERQASLYDQFTEIAPTIYFETSSADYFNAVKNNVTILGKLFDKEDFAREKLTEIEQAVSDLKEKVTALGANALVVLANDGSISAYGDNSRFGMVYNNFGFQPADPNIEASTHGQSITFEYILEKNPDYILVIDRAATTGGSVTAEQLFDNELIKQTDAYKNNRIIYLSSQIWYVASGGIAGTMTMINDVVSNL